MPSMTTWEDAFTANTTTTGIQDQVGTFQLHNGDFWVTWRDDQDTLAGDTDGRTDILGQRYDPLGNPIGGPVRLNGTSFAGDQLNASFVANPADGGFIGVYETRTTMNGQAMSQIWLQYHDADGTLTSSGNIDSAYDSGFAPHDPEIAVASSTNALVVWERTNSAGDTDIMARFIEPYSHTMSPAFEVLNQADDNYDPHVVALTNGNYAVIWTDEYNGSTTDLDIRGKIYNQSGAVVGTLAIATSVSTEADASITALAGGGFVVSYTRTDGSNNGDVLFRIYDASGVAAAPATLVVSGANAQGHSSVSATADGGFVLSWVDATLGKTMVQTFTSTGLPVDVTVLADTAVSGAVSLTMLGDGRLLAGYGIGDNAQAVILDPRSTANADAAYTPEGWQIGTQGNDSIDVAADTTRVYGMDGSDFISVDSVTAGAIIDGGGGAYADTLNFHGFTADIEVDLEAGIATSGGQSMTVTGFRNVYESLVDGRMIVHGNGLTNDISTGNGDDVLDGGAGADWMYGSVGSDTYFVDNAGDLIGEYGVGNDTVLTSVSYTLAAGESLEALSAIDEEATDAINLTGNEIANTLGGNAGKNVLDGGAGIDTMFGGGGDDSYYVDDAGDAALEWFEGGNDRVFASVDYTLGAGSYVEVLSTTDDSGTGIIKLVGNEFANTIYGNAGTNRLDGGAGADVLVGFGGTDLYYIDNAGDVVIENAGDSGVDRIFSSVNYTLGAGVHVEWLSTLFNDFTPINLTGNGLNNTVDGNAGVNVLDGRAGNDVVRAGEGNDTLIGGLGYDTMEGGTGDDMYYVDNLLDKVTELAGEGTADRILTSITYTLGAGVDVEKLTTDNNNGTTALNLTGNEIANVIYGNAGDNVLTGKEGNDSLTGFAGNDTLVGGVGNDTMAGGLGDDWYYVDSTSDIVIEVGGEGTGDRILTSVSYTLGAGVEIERLTTANNAGTEAINLTGSAVGNLMYGNAGNNVLDGRGGADTLVGFGGDDSYYVDNAGDKITEAASEGASDRIFAGVSYTLGAGVHVEKLTTDNNAGTSAINFTGNELANQIYGNAGANVLDGKGGADLLVGLEGQDSFAFTTALGGGNVDTISGFAVADDTIRLDNAVFAGLADGALAAGAFNTGSAAMQADDRVIYNAATGALLFDADGTGGAAAVQFATLAGGLALTSADFLVV